MSINSKALDINETLSYPTDYDDGKTEFPFNSVVKEEEDNDGEVRSISSSEKLTEFMATSTLIKTIIGIGVLNLPFIFQKLGILLSLVLIILTYQIEFTSVYCLLKCKDITKKYGYSMYAKICFGKCGGLFIKLMIIGELFGCCCAHLKIFGEIIKSIALFFRFDDDLLTNEKFYTFFMSIIILPLIFNENILSYKKTSLIGVISIIFFLSGIVFSFFFKLFKKQIHFKLSMLFPSTPVSFVDCFKSFTVLLEAYTFQAIIFALYLSLKEKKNKTMKRITSKSLKFCSAIYLMTGLLCRIMLDSNANNSIELLNNGLEKYRGKIFICALIICIMLAVLTSSLFTFPITFFALKTNFLNVCVILKKTFYQKKDALGNKTLAISDLGKRVLTFILYALILCISLYADTVINICNLIGSTCTNVINILAPTGFLLLLSKTTPFSQKYLWEKCVFLIGIFILLAFISTEIYQFIYSNN